MRRLEKRMRQCLVALRELAVNILFITREILSRKQNDREKISMHALPLILFQLGTRDSSGKHFKILVLRYF